LNSVLPREDGRETVHRSIGAATAIIGASVFALILTRSPRIPNAISDEEYEVYSEWTRSHFAKHPPDGQLYLLSRTFKFNPVDQRGACRQPTIGKAHVPASLTRQFAAWAARNISSAVIPPRVFVCHGNILLSTHLPICSRVHFTSWRFPESRSIGTTKRHCLQSAMRVPQAIVAVERRFTHAGSKDIGRSSPLIASGCIDRPGERSRSSTSCGLRPRPRREFPRRPPSGIALSCPPLLGPTSAAGM